MKLLLVALLLIGLSVGRAGAADNPATSAWCRATVQKINDNGVLLDDAPAATLTDLQDPIEKLAYGQGIAVDWPAKDDAPPQDNFFDDGFAADGSVLARRMRDADRTANQLTWSYFADDRLGMVGWADNGGGVAFYFYRMDDDGQLSWIDPPPVFDGGGNKIAAGDHRGLLARIGGQVSFIREDFKVGLTLTLSPWRDGNWAGSCQMSASVGAPVLLR